MVTQAEEDRLLFNKIAKWGGTGAALMLCLLTFGCGSWFTVDQTELANVRRFGVVQYAQPLTPGFHFKMPLIDTPDKIRVTLQTIHIPPFDVLTVDNQKVTIEENFNFTIAPGQVHHVLYEVGESGYEGIEHQIIPVTHDRTARIFAAQNMVTVNANREAIQEQIEASIHGTVEQLFGITPHSLQITAIKPSDNFMHSIDEATMAKNQAIAAENQLRTKQFEAQQAAATAKGSADAAIEQARGQAESTKLNATANAAARVATATAEAKAIQMQGEAQALAMKAQADAITANPQLIEWKKAEKWNGAFPTTMVPNGALPFMSVGPK